MKFGAMLAGQYHPEESPLDQMASAIEQVRTARDAGFDSVWMVQHFRADFAFLQPLPFLARLAAESGEMTLGTGIALMPFYPPVMFAEEMATLDIITGGRLILGVGSGYREDEFEAFGLSKKNRNSRFAESIETVEKLWKGEEITEAGKHYDLQGITLNTRPLRDTIPLWIGVVGDQAVARAGRWGREWLVGPEVPPDEVVRKQGIYKEALKEAGHSQNLQYPIMRETVVAPTREEALSGAGANLLKKYDVYRKWGHNVASEEALVKSVFVIGSPDDCVQQLSAFREQTGTDHLIMRIQWPGSSHADAMRTIEQVGESVIPVMRS